MRLTHLTATGLIAGLVGLLSTAAGGRGGPPPAGAAPAATRPAADPTAFMWAVRSWDLPDGQDLSALALSPDAAHVAFAAGGTLGVVDRAGGADVWRMADAGRSVAALHFTADGKHLVVAGRWTSHGRKGVAVLDAATGAAVNEFEADPIATLDAVPSPDGSSVLACGGSDFTAEGRHAALWDARTGRLLHDPDDGGGDGGGRRRRSTTAVAFLPDGRHYVCDHGDSVGLHETAGGRLVKRVGVVRPEFLAVSAGGDTVLVCGQAGLTVWDLAGDHTRDVGAAGPRTAGAAFVGADRCVTWGAELRMWDLQTGQEVSWSGRYEQDVALGAAAGDYVVGGGGRHFRVWGLPGVAAAPPGEDPVAGRPPDDRSRPAPPLVAAAERGDAARVAALLARGADVGAMRGWADRTGTTALHAARGYAVARALVDAGADPNAASSEDWGRTPLHYAVERYAAGGAGEAGGESMKVVDLLLDKGADVEATFGYLQTPLQTAALAGERELAAHLIARGAYFDIDSAAALGDAGRLRALLAGDPELATRLNPMTKRNALYWARTPEAVDVLLGAGTRADVKDAWNATPAEDLRGNRHEVLAAYLDRQRPPR